MIKIDIKCLLLCFDDIDIGDYNDHSDNYDDFDEDNDNFTDYIEDNNDGDDYDDNLRMIMV